MCNLEKKYKAFALALENRSADREDSYREICGRLKVSPLDLDEILYEELGMGGEEIVGIYRSGFGKHSGQAHEFLNPQLFRPEVEN